MAIKVMSLEKIEEMVRGEELAAQLTEEPQCPTHRCRMIRQPAGLVCPLCREQLKIDMVRDSATHLL